MSEPDRYRWRTKEDFRATWQVSNATIDRRVRDGRIEKTIIGVKPVFRWKPEGNTETALVPLSATQRVVVPEEAYNDLVMRLEAQSVKLDQMQKMLLELRDAKSRRRRSWWHRLLYGDYDP